MPNYTLAVQRRGIPFFYVAKIVFIGLLLLLIGRIMYGYAGGFRTKVVVIRIEKKRIANKVLIVGLFFFIWFSTSFIGATFQSIRLTDAWFTKVIVGHAEDSKKTLLDVIVISKLT